MKFIFLFISLFSFSAFAKPKTHFPEIGAQYFLDTLGAPLVTVVGVEGPDDYVIHYDTGNFAGKLGRSWHAVDFLKMSGCAAKSFCVGDRYLVPDRDYVEATIAAIGFEGEMVLHFDTGEYAGTYGDGWHKNDLMPLSYEHYIQR